MTTVTLLHPGAMGAEVGAQAHHAGARVLHVPTGRGPASVERARKGGLEAAESLGSALAVSDLVLSICPPHAAEDVARKVLDHAFTGVYVEANAISPDRALRIDAACRERGVVMVDGSIIGAPPGADSSPRLYLSGDQKAVGRVAAVFEGTAVLARPLDAEVGAASALKMAFASFQKSARVPGLSGGSCRRRGAWHALPQALRAGGAPSGVVVGCRLPKLSASLEQGGPPSRRRPPPPCSCTHQAPLTSVHKAPPVSCDLIRRTGPGSRLARTRHASRSGCRTDPGGRVDHL
ncbi:NAD(P)-binding domain-containing protein [Streptomyces olivochromogenes]|uniref:NAD(P)-binding domain-containing protein n=1 Tax=Streptomyces olivochromogenes TaxID=1963 RepID=UPI0036C95660